jgi:cbb3-type cytochrome oxidase maturation protein
MSIIFFMIGVSLFMAVGFLSAFIWSMRSGQQDDLYTPSLRMLLDDSPPDEPAAIPPDAPALPDSTRLNVLKKSVTAV